MEYNWKEVYMWFYKEPLMPTENFWYLWVRIQTPDRTMIMCNECGKFFKRLHTKHLIKHWLTIDEYRTKYGYNKTTSMIADQESVNISKRILGKAHSVHLNKEAQEKRKINHAKALSEWKSTWAVTNERQNWYWTCIAQVGDRLKNYIERYWRPPTYNAIGEDGKALYSMLKHRYGDINKWFRVYWLPTKKLIPWECVEYSFEDWEVIQVWYKHDNWEELYSKIKSTCKLFES